MTFLGSDAKRIKKLTVTWKNCGKENLMRNIAICVAIALLYVFCFALSAQEVDRTGTITGQDVKPVPIPLKPKNDPESGKAEFPPNLENPQQKDMFAKAASILENSKYDATTLEFKRFLEENKDFKKTAEYAFLMFRVAKANNDPDAIEYWTKIALMRIGKTEYKALEWLFNLFEDMEKRKIIDTMVQWSPEQIQFVDDFVHGTYCEKQRNALANLVALEISSGDKMRNLLFWWNLTTILSGIGVVIFVAVVSNCTINWINKKRSKTKPA